jgi:predicted GIY-YIG superfamily endonuclease
MSKSKTDIYILKLNDKKYYVGKTKDLEKRFMEHINGNGSTWTKKHKPIEIEKVIKDASPFDEDKFVKEYMSKYGIENVRGGSYVKEVLDEKDINTLQNEIRNATDCCTKCGNKGHFVKDCYVKNKSKYKDVNIFTSASIKTCFDCGSSGHYSSECTNKKTIKIETGMKKMNIFDKKYQTISICYRCGREGHYSIGCYAKSDSNGNELEDSDSDTDSNGNELEDSDSDTDSDDNELEDSDSDTDSDDNELEDSDTDDDCEEQSYEEYDDDNEDDETYSD